MSSQYSLSRALRKTLFCPVCRVCGLQKAAFRGHLCVSCIRAILKDFFFAHGDKEALLRGSRSSIRLVGVLREERPLWVRSIFFKLLRRKFGALSGIDAITLVPQRKRAVPSGLRLFCEALSASEGVSFVLNGLTKQSARSQHGFPARERMDCERFIAGNRLESLAGHILLLDDVETTGTSMLQAEAALRRVAGVSVRRLALVKAGNSEEEHTQDECG